MSPISCVFNATAHDELIVCVYRVGINYMMPVFNTFGGPNSWNNWPDIEPHYCGCGPDEPGHTEECNRFAFLNGLVFYKTPLPTVNVEILVLLYSSYGRNYNEYNKLFYTASFYAATRNPAAQAELTSVCGEDCGLLVVASGDHPSAPNHVVFSYKSELLTASCNNSFSTPFYSRLGT